MKHQTAAKLTDIRDLNMVEDLRNKLAATGLVDLFEVNRMPRSQRTATVWPVLPAEPIRLSPAYACGTCRPSRVGTALHRKVRR